MSNQDFITLYLDYNKHTEPPYVYHRWCAISTIAALLGRQFWLPFGNGRIFPNLYIMLLGDAGARKSTAIKSARKLATSAGYETFAADKTSKEKFLLDLEGHITDEMQEEYLNGQRTSGVHKKKYDPIMSANLWGNKADTLSEPREVYISADEFNEFAGTGNLEFYTTLGNLWDWDDTDRPFTQRLKNSRSVSIYQPTINILGGNTSDNFARAFPPEIMGQGFLSRMLIIYGERSSRRYSLPPEIEKENKDEITGTLKRIRSGSCRGAATISKPAIAILDKLYREWTEINDVRFKSYSNRRYTQLLKLALNIAASMENTVIGEGIILTANTILAAAEHNMPLAIGEFGKSKNSDVSNKIMDVLSKATKPLSMQDLWKQVRTDLDSPQKLGEILSNLAQAEMVFYMKERGGWLPKKLLGKKPEFVDWSLLTEEERSMIGASST